jgi:uncharacterized protein YacL
MNRLIRWLLLLMYAALCAWIGYFISARPFVGLVSGVLVAGASVLFERRMRETPSKVIAGGLLGLVLAVGLAAVVFGVLSLFRGTVSPDLPEAGRWLVPAGVLLAVALGYIGLTLGVKKASQFEWLKLPFFQNQGKGTTSYKILDTSVIIDGRIADLVDTGFFDGVIVVPQFVLRELQYVADSSDALKRNRGRRGLDILQRLQKRADVNVHVSETDFPDIRDVDMKLIELAKQMGGKIVTNDFNLNKISGLRGVQVLNINELANALKPVVLPGETMKVFILKEGKESNQGVAYLDDGTMVVADNARRVIGKTVTIEVTSVLQTTAGKMIFGRYSGSGHEERDRRPPPRNSVRE